MVYEKDLKLTVSDLKKGLPIPARSTPVAPLAIYVEALVSFWRLIQFEPIVFNGFHQLIVFKG